MKLSNELLAFAADLIRRELLVPNGLPTPALPITTGCLGDADDDCEDGHLYAFTRTVQPRDGFAVSLYIKINEANHATFEEAMASLAHELLHVALTAAYNNGEHDWMFESYALALGLGKPTAWAYPGEGFSRWYRKSAAPALAAAGFVEPPVVHPTIMEVDARAMKLMTPDALLSTGLKNENEILERFRAEARAQLTKEAQNV